MTHHGHGGQPDGAGEGDGHGLHHGGAGVRGWTGEASDVLGLSPGDLNALGLTPGDLNAWSSGSHS